MPIKTYFAEKISGNSLTIPRNIHLFLLGFIVLVLLSYTYGCVSTLQNKDSDSGGLIVTPQGPSTTSWIGNDGRTYTIEWGEPQYGKQLQVIGE